MRQRVGWKKVRQRQSTNERGRCERANEYDGKGNNTKVSAEKLKREHATVQKGTPKYAKNYEGTKRNTERQEEQ